MTNLLKSIIIVDGSSGGHHQYFLEAICEGLVSSRRNAVVLSQYSESIRERITVSHLKTTSDLRFIDYSDDSDFLNLPLHPLVREAIITAKLWIKVRKEIRKIESEGLKVELVFFAWLDRYLNPLIPAALLDLFFRYKWSGIYFHPRHYRKSQNNTTFCKRLFLYDSLLKNSKNCAGFALLDAHIIGRVAKAMKTKHVRALPDFDDEDQCSSDSVISDEINTLAGQRKIIGLLGSLEKRKGVLTLIEVARIADKNKFFFVFVGELAETTFNEAERNYIRLRMKEYQENCYFRLQRVLRNSEFNTIFNNCDIVFAAYCNFPHSSNMLTKAAKYRKNVIVSSGGYMEEIVRKYQLGAVVTENDYLECYEAILKLSGDRESIKPQFDAFAVINTKQQFKTKFDRLIDTLVNDNQSVVVG
jgi:glycosyltransferase involved in cell wall biosynthesis